MHSRVTPLASDGLQVVQAHQFVLLKLIEDADTAVHQLSQRQVNRRLELKLTTDEVAGPCLLSHESRRYPREIDLW